MNQPNRIGEKFEKCIERSSLVERAVFDTIMSEKGEHTINVTFADLLFEVLQLGKELAVLQEQVEEIEESL